jgi:competence protein ComEC
MQVLTFVFRLFITIFFFCLLNCVTQNIKNENKFDFFAVDVGQGLSQIAVLDKNVIIFDVGDTFAFENWFNTLKNLGDVKISSIVISHTHIDHMGGLRFLPENINFTGRIVTSIYEDTSYIRNQCQFLKEKIWFKTISANDTIAGLEGVYIKCLWPPKDSVNLVSTEENKNRYSLCFKLEYNLNSALITSDIDSVAMKQMDSIYGFFLYSQIICIPHHGSNSGFEPVFYGFVNPTYAIISCGQNNPYGHPSQKILDLLLQMHVKYYQTWQDGTIFFSSNGYYWTIK